MQDSTEVKCPKCQQLVNSELDACPNCKEEFFNCSDCNGLVLGTDKVCRNCKTVLDSKKENIIEMKLISHSQFMNTSHSKYLLIFY